MTDEVKGVVAVFIDKHGQVTAHAADFERAGYGGYSLRQSQEMRARKLLHSAVVRAYCASVVYEATSEYDRSGIVSNMVANGAKVHIINIGWPDGE